MPSLREIQNAFIADLIGNTAAVAPILSPSVFPAERLLQIYRNNLFISLSDALLAVYPVVRRLVGDDFFAFSSREYIRAHPSRSGNLHGFGSAFADFLARFPPAMGLVYLADVACLEWACHRAFHAATHAPFDPRRLAGVSAETYGELRFTLHPSARLLSSSYPVSRIWEANQPEAEADATLDLSMGGETVLVCRPDSQVLVRRLAPAEGAWLAHLARGEKLETAAEAAWALDPEFALDQALLMHVAQGTLVDLAVTANEPYPSEETNHVDNP